MDYSNPEFIAAIQAAVKAASLAARAQEERNNQIEAETQARNARKFLDGRFDGDKISVDDFKYLLDKHLTNDVLVQLAQVNCCKTELDEIRRVSLKYVNEGEESISADEIQLLQDSLQTLREKQENRCKNQKYPDTWEKARSKFTSFLQSAFLAVPCFRMMDNIKCTNPNYFLFIHYVCRKIANYFFLYSALNGDEFPSDVVLANGSHPRWSEKNALTFTSKTPVVVVMSFTPYGKSFISKYMFHSSYH